MDEVNEIYCALIDNFYFTEEELRLVTDINGWSIETLRAGLKRVVWEVVTDGKTWERVIE